MTSENGSGPDSAAVRAQRARRHKAGDHSMCKPDRCPVLSSRDDRDGPVTAALLVLLAELHYEQGDPRHVLGAVALQLAAALDRSPANVAVARELRGHVSALTEHPNERAGIVDELRARRASRRVTFLLDRHERTGSGE